MAKARRQKKPINDAELRQLWASRLTEKDIAKVLGHKPWVLRRRAVKIGLPSSRRKLWEEKSTRT